MTTERVTKRPPVLSEEPLPPYGENAFAYLTAVDKGLRRAGATVEQRKAFSDEATAGDYDHLMDVCRKWTA